MLYALSPIPEPELRDLLELESSLGKTLIALTPIDLEAEPLQDHELEKVRTLEAKLGRVLVAVRN